MLIDFGDARFAVVTTGFTMQKYRSPAIELYGTHGVLQLLGDDWAPEGYEQWRNDTGVWELYPETDPTWPWTDGLRHLVECIETGDRAGDAARARLPRARDHARRAGGRRRGPRARDPLGLPRARPGRLGAVATAAPSGSTTRGARCERWSSGRALPTSVAAAGFDGPAQIRRADVTRHIWGDAEAGEVVRLDLRLDRAGPHAACSGCRPGGAFRHSRGVPHDLRRRRGAARALGHDGPREPRDRRGRARRRRARACSSAATPGTTRSPSGRSRCACSSCSRRRRPRARRAPTRAPSPTSRPRATRTTRCSGSWPPRHARPRAAARWCGRATCCTAATAARSCGVLASTEHLTVAHARARPGRGRRAARARRRRGADGARGPALGARVARRRGARLRARAARTRATCRRAAVHEYRNPGAATARAICGVAPELAAVSRPSASTSAAPSWPPRASTPAPARCWRRGARRRGRRGGPRRCSRTASRSRTSWGRGRAASPSASSSIPPGACAAPRRSTGAAPTSPRSTRVESDVRAAALAEARFGAGGQPTSSTSASARASATASICDGAPRLGVRGSAIGTGAPLVEQWSERAGAGAPQRPRERGGGARRPGLRGAGRRRGAAARARARRARERARSGRRGDRRRARARTTGTARASSMRCGRRVYDPEARDLPVVPAALGADAPVIGAALAAAARARA